MKTGGKRVLDHIFETLISLRPKSRLSLKQFWIEGLLLTAENTPIHTNSLCTYLNYSLTRRNESLFPLISCYISHVICPLEQHQQPSAVSISALRLVCAADSYITLPHGSLTSLSDLSWFLSFSRWSKKKKSGSTWLSFG